MLVTDWSRLGNRSARDLVLEARDGGVTMVQLRERWPVEFQYEGVPTLTGEDLEGFELAVSTARAAATVGPSVLLFAHGGDEAAHAAIGASVEGVGVHLPERPVRGFSAPPRVASIRKRYRESLIISRSVHRTDAAVAAERDGADVLVLGTVFPSKSHPGGPTIGIEGVCEVCAAVKIPVIGIGGINAQNAGDVIRAGASGVAVIGAIFDAPDPRAAAAELRAEIDKAWQERTEG